MKQLLIAIRNSSSNRGKFKGLLVSSTSRQKKTVSVEYLDLLKMETLTNLTDHKITGYNCLWFSPKQISIIETNLWEATDFKCLIFKHLLWTTQLQIIAPWLVEVRTMLIIMFQHLATGTWKTKTDNSLVSMLTSSISFRKGKECTAYRSNREELKA
jgi:hypothetical protein